MYVHLTVLLSRCSVSAFLEKLTNLHTPVRYTYPNDLRYNTMDLQHYLDHLEEFCNNFVLLYGILLRLSNICMHIPFL
jgi:hypothetical protein